MLIFKTQETFDNLYLSISICWFMQNQQKGGEDVHPVWLLTCVEITVVCTDQVI